MRVLASRLPPPGDNNTEGQFEKDVEEFLGATSNDPARGVCVVHNPLDPCGVRVFEETRNELRAKGLQVFDIVSLATQQDGVEGKNEEVEGDMHASMSKDLYPYGLVVILTQGVPESIPFTTGVMDTWAKGAKATSVDTELGIVFHAKDGQCGEDAQCMDREQLQANVEHLLA